MYNLPDDILRRIYEYDDTYIIKYNKCINEMNYFFPYNHVIDNMNLINFAYNMYKRYCEINNSRFNSDIYNPIMCLSEYYKHFVIVHPQRHHLKRKNIKKQKTITKKISI